MAVAMEWTAARITRKQYTAMMRQLSDYGVSMARFIAAQNAASVVGEDWETVEVARAGDSGDAQLRATLAMNLAGTLHVPGQPGRATVPAGGHRARAWATASSSCDTRRRVNRYWASKRRHCSRIGWWPGGQVAFGLPERLAAS